MRAIEPVGEHGVLIAADVDRTVEGLNGVFAARDLYARYEEAAREAGHTPAHPVAFGQALARKGFLRRKKNVKVQGRTTQVVAWVL